MFAPETELADFVHCNLPPSWTSEGKICPKQHQQSLPQITNKEYEKTNQISGETFGEFPYRASFPALSLQLCSH
jgi:hypothetical protein